MLGPMPASSHAAGRPSALFIGSRFTRPRRRAKLRSPERLALREELLDVRQRVHRRPAHQVVGEVVFAVFAPPPKSACFGRSLGHARGRRCGRHGAAMPSRRAAGFTLVGLQFVVIEVMGRISTGPQCVMA
jgi:hypothetical protein